MKLNKTPVWAAVLLLSSATLAYGQATQVPAPGGTVPPVATPRPEPTPPGPTPQSATGQNAVVPAPGGNPPPVVTPVNPAAPTGPTPQGGTVKP
ncbi:MAG: hypothetical protein WDM91_19670 [Rhizomicrobium sp.]